MRALNAAKKMTKAELRERIQSCIQQDALTTKATWSALTKRDKTIFCIHRDMYKADAKMLAPLIGDCDIVLAKRRKNAFIAFECHDWPKSREIVYRLQIFSRTARRIARVQKAVGHHLKEHLRTLWSIQGGRCYFSGEPLGQSFEEEKFSVDHLIPLATRSFPFTDIPGTNWPTNLALVTLRVNRMKGARRPEEFLREVVQMKSFEPLSIKERRRIDKTRKHVFRDYMSLHCSKYEDDCC
jgi:hypothetical protein